MTLTSCLYLPNPETTGVCHQVFRLHPHAFLNLVRAPFHASSSKVPRGSQLPEACPASKVPTFCTGCLHGANRPRLPSRSPSAARPGLAVERQHDRLDPPSARGPQSGPRPRVPWKSVGRGAGLTRLTDAAPGRWVPSAVTLASALQRWHRLATEDSRGSDLKLESPGAAGFFHWVLDSPPYGDYEPRPQLLDGGGGRGRCATVRRRTRDPRREKGFGGILHLQWQREFGAEMT